LNGQCTVHLVGHHAIVVSLGAGVLDRRGATWETNRDGLRANPMIDSRSAPAGDYNGFEALTTGDAGRGEDQPSAKEPCRAKT
jgi:hypothetical protein